MLAALLACGLVRLCGGARLARPAAHGAHTQDADAVKDQDVDDFGLDESTWMGLEDRNASGLEPRNLTGTVASVNTSALSDRGYPTVMLLGLFNTGTNLLEKLLLKNFPGIPHQMGGGSLQVWKHIKPEHLQQQLQAQGRPHVIAERGVVTIAVIRDPMSWVQSMRKAPYDLVGCMGAFDWPTKSCTFPQAGVRPSTVFCPYCVTHGSSFHVPNIESVWNQWNWEYDHLESVVKLAPGRTVVVTYEDIVLNTMGTLKKIAAALGKPAPAQVKHIHAPAKTHGSPNGRMQAIRKLKNKPYLRSYLGDQQRKVCQLLDKERMHFHNYHDCDSV